MMKIRKVSLTDTAYPIRPEELWLPQSYESKLRSDVTNAPLKVLLRPQAVRQLLEFIQWGENSLRNRMEQAGMLYGYIAVPTEDPDQLREDMPRVTVICGMFGADTPESTPTSVVIPANEWLRMDLELDKLNAQRSRQGKPSMQKMGWVHTHPGGLEPFFSSVDHAQQPAQASSMDRVGLVFNPHRQIWSAYAGAEGVQVRGRLQLDDGLLAQYEFREKTPWEAARGRIYQCSPRPTLLPQRQELPVPGAAQSGTVEPPPRKQNMELQLQTTIATYCYDLQRGCICPVREGCRVELASYRQLMELQRIFGPKPELMVCLQQENGFVRLIPQECCCAGLQLRGTSAANGGRKVLFVEQTYWHRVIEEHYKRKWDWYFGTQRGEYLVASDEKICWLPSGN